MTREDAFGSQNPRSVPLVYQRLRRFRGVIAPSLDCLIWIVGLTAATLLRYGVSAPGFPVRGLVIASSVVVGCQLVVGTFTQLYRVRWRIGSFEEMAALAQTIAAVTVVITVVSVVPHRHLVPASATVAGGTLALVVSGAIRCVWRLNWERRLRPTGQTQRAVVFGAGEGGVQLINALATDPFSPYLAVALLDDDPAKARLRVRSLRVGGTRADLAAVAARYGAETVIVAIPSADSPLIRAVSDLAVAARLTVKVLPPVARMFELPVTAKAIRPVTESDLLGRRMVDTDIASVAGYLRGRRVLVTGAGGSIGSELCRQISRFEPSNLVMLDRDESGLHQVQLSIEGRAMLDSRSLVVCDIRDREALDAVFAEHQPDVVFHAAALKHLPLLEMWPAEAVKTNVLGTHNVLEAAAAAGVDQFVNVSTDKAANPCSVLGYTKRLAERLTAETGSRTQGAYLSVRFGNVLGSRGSVLTTFRSQIKAGMPVTVTHPDVTRYFMMVEEAVQLVVQAGAIGRSGEVLVLDMGQPVRIVEVAERLVVESGRDIKILYTGLRPAEKLHEELFGTGEVGIRERHPLISHVAVPPIGASMLDALKSGLRGSAEELLDRLRHYHSVAPDDSASVGVSPRVGAGTQVAGTGH